MLTKVRLIADPRDVALAERRRLTMVGVVGFVFGLIAGAAWL